MSFALSVCVLFIFLMQLINATFLFFSSVRFAATNCASALPVGGPIK